MSKTYRNLLVGLLLLLLVALPLLAACAKEAPAPTPKPAPAPAPTWQWPKAIAVAAGETGSRGYMLSAAWAPVLEATTGTKVRIVPEGISVARRNLLRNGDLALNSNSISADVADGIEVTKHDATREGGPYPQRFAWMSISGYFSFVSRGDSKIKTMADIKPGVRISSFDIPGFIKANSGFLSWAGLDPQKDAVWVKTGSWKAAVQAVVDGRADITYVSAQGPVIVEALENPHGLNFIALPKDDPEGMARHLSYRPTHMFGPVARGVKQAIGVYGIRAPQAYYAHAEKTDTELVYHLAKWFNENFDQYKGNYTDTDGMALETVRWLLDFIYLPVHEGTIKYMKELGMWTAKDDLRQKYNLNLLNRYIKAYQEAIKRADAQGIEVKPLHEPWMKLWADYKKELNLPSFRVLTDADIAAALK